MGENFRVRFRFEIVVAVLDELIFQRLVIFDHAIVHERDLAAGVEMRMRILIVDLAVRGPTSVADSELTRRAGLPSEAGRGRRYDRRISASAICSPLIMAMPGGIVAAVFEATQTIEEDGSRFRTAYVTDNSAHGSGRRELNPCGGGGQLWEACILTPFPIRGVFEIRC